MFRTFPRMADIFTSDTFCFNLVIQYWFVFFGLRVLTIVRNHSIQIIDSPSFYIFVIAEISNNVIIHHII